MKRRIIAILLSMLTIAAVCLSAGCNAPMEIFAPVDKELSAPVFSHETGSYDEDFTLTVTTDKRTVVRYTLDGSMPTAESPKFPEEGMVITDRSDQPNDLSAIDTYEITRETDHVPGTVAKGTVIRAAAFTRNGKSMSPVTTETYLVGMPYEDIKVISLVLDRDSLFDYETGIYVLGKHYADWMMTDPDAPTAQTWELQGNFSQKGRDWEREVHMQLIEADGSFAIEQPMGIRIMGSATRTYYQKSFRLYAREDYGPKRFSYPIIPGLVTESAKEPLEKFKTFNLRNGGNDNYHTLLRDPFVQALVPDRAFATQGAEFCIVFINGEYWGIYCITEDYSDNFVEDNYGVDKDNAIVMKNNEVDDGEPEDVELYNELKGSFYWRDFTQPEHYQWFCDTVDLQSYIDYMAVQLYIDNGDGPYDGNNCRIWRAREPDPECEYADGRWRFLLNDSDFAFGYQKDKGDATYNNLQDVQGRDWGWSLMLNKLMENEQFRPQFINTYMDLRNTAFNPESALATLDEMKSVISPYINEQYERNGPTWAVGWGDDYFRNELNVIRDFVRTRYDYAVTMLQEGYELSEAKNITLSASETEGGTVQVGTVTPDLTDGAWQGKYFAEYPINLTATPAEGYIFTGWSGDISDDQSAITLTLSKDMEIVANFEKE
ncbi:MAG: hypothetical protein E7559_03310 [Ruminococcaceae bacterium]|nr:hypothetical protein [Oscillospiraceae bacterium]